MGGDAAHFCLCTALFGQPFNKLATPIAAAIVAQLLFGFVWYGLIMKNPYVRSLAVDKGVKAVAFVRVQYNAIMCTLGSVITGLFRAAAVVAVMHHILVQKSAANSLCMYSQAGTAVWLVVALAHAEEAFYAQRPMSLIIVNSGYNLGCCLVASAVLFFIKV